MGVSTCGRTTRRRRASRRSSRSSRSREGLDSQDPTSRPERAVSDGRRRCARGTPPLPSTGPPDSPVNRGPTSRRAVASAALATRWGAGSVLAPVCAAAPLLAIASGRWECRALGGPARPRPNGNEAMVPGRPAPGAALRTSHRGLRACRAIPRSGDRRRRLASGVAVKVCFGAVPCGEGDERGRIGPEAGGPDATACGVLHHDAPGVGTSGPSLACLGRRWPAVTRDGGDRARVMENCRTAGQPTAG
jgi:hypothetical protein